MLFLLTQHGSRATKTEHFFFASNLSELLHPQGDAASYPADCLVVDFFRPPLLGLTSGQ